MSVRAKFVVETVEDWNEGKSIKLHAVYDGSPENKEFFQYTPAGYIQLSTVNLAAAKQFEVGKHLYVDFTEAPA